MTAEAREMTVHEAMLDWNHAKEFLRNAVRHDMDEDMVLRGVQARVFSGIDTLWKMQDEKGRIVAYAVSALYTTDGVVTTAQIHMACAEEVEPLVEHLAQFESWARQRGVHYLEVIGRRGWEKFLRPQGFTFDHISLIKRINNGLH